MGALSELQSQKKLLKCFVYRNKNKFVFCLRTLDVIPNVPIPELDNRTIFEEILQTPNTRDFIQLCVAAGGVDFYRPNEANNYLLHYAVSSFCADNLEALLNFFHINLNVCHDDIRFMSIVNQVNTLDGRNYLSFLIHQITTDNCEEILAMMKILLSYGCNVNQSDYQLCTPFYSILKKRQELPIIPDGIITDFLKHSTYLSVFKQSETLEMLNEIGFSNPATMSIPKDISYMLRLIYDRNESEFAAEFENSKKVFTEVDLDTMSIEAVIRGLEKVVKLILTCNVRAEQKQYLTFAACSQGHVDILKTLLQRDDVQFYSKNIRRNLLHEICSTSSYDKKRIKACFDEIVEDNRCDKNVLNATDKYNKTPLYYACINEHEEIVLELLRQGAYLGSELVIKNMKRDWLERVLDESIYCKKNFSDKSFEINLNYNILKPTNGKREIDPLIEILQHSNLSNLISHPILATFIYMKWKRINFIAYLNIFLYFIYIISPGALIMFDMLTHHNRALIHHCCYFVDFNATIFDHLIEQDDHRWRHEQNEFIVNKHLKDNSLRFDHFSKMCTRFGVIKINSLRIFLVIAILFLFTLIELIQMVTSFRNYFFKFSNWLDMLMICILWLTPFTPFFPEYCYLSAISLIVAAQTIQTLGRVSFLSMSVHIAIFKRVYVTFLKFMALYSILFVAFAVSFYVIFEGVNYRWLLKKANLHIVIKYIMNDFNYDYENYTANDPQQNFGDLISAMITVVRMMLTDFGVGIDFTDTFQGPLFLLFSVTISIVLFNLLLAITISDTAYIKSQAELVNLQKQIHFIESYDKFFGYFKINYANIFSQLMPTGRIVVTPNGDRTLKIHREFDVNMLINCDQKNQSIMKGTKGPKKFMFHSNALLKLMNYVKDRQ